MKKLIPHPLSLIPKKGDEMRVLKLSGHELDDLAYLGRFATAVANLHQQEAVVIVHGGGKTISTMQARLGLAEVKIDGLRVTDPESLLLTEMVLSGYVNKLIVRALQQAGVNALGLSGADGHLLLAQKKVSDKGDLGAVGEIVAVNAALLQKVLGLGFVPVISPVSVAVEQPLQAYNVNGDEAATAVAQALSADQLDFISNVAGVWRDLTGAVFPTLTAEEVERYTAVGLISGGMIPKVQAALEAIAQGVKQARIVDLPHLLEGGTLFVRE
jgi:acetylglutamate kinase